MTRTSMFRRRTPGLALAAAFVLGTAGCVEYRAHVTVEPGGEVHVREQVETQPGVRESLRVAPELAWASFRSLTESRGGRFVKDSRDSTAGAVATYTIDDWTEFGQKGPAFKSLDEVERRTSPANVQSNVKDQYFYRDVTLEYAVRLSEPSGVTVDSVAAPFLQGARGTLVVEVPGDVLATNAPTREGDRRLVWPLAYGTDLDAEVTYRRYEWTAVVSVVLVAGFLAWLAFQGIRRLARRGKPQPELA